MSLKFEIDSLEGVDESLRTLYQEHQGKFRLKVEGIDPADELKEALRKEREERAAAKQKLSEYEKQQAEAETKRMAERQEFEKLWKAEQEKGTKTLAELDELKRKIADKERREVSGEVVTALTRDTARAELLTDRALQFIHHTPEGVKINGPDGEAWDAKRLGEYLSSKYPFLVDGSQANGGGAAGGKGGGAVSKKFHEMTGAELSALRQSNPAEYERLKKAHYGT
jgi:flagellar biosynthesis GTPase FlhF